MVTGHGPTMLDKIASYAGPIGKLAMAVAPAIASINTEVKYGDYQQTLNAWNPGTSDQIACLTNNISQGLTDQSRIGNSILAKDISAKFTVNYSVSPTALVSQTRIVMFVWKDNANANVPTAAKIFETPSLFLSAFNKDYTDQMVILKDKIICHNAPISGTYAGCFSSFKVHKKLDFHMRWLDATTGNSQNHIYVLVRGLWTTSTNSSNVTLYSRMNFTDN